MSSRSRPRQRNQRLDRGRETLVSPLISVQYYYFTEQRSKGRAATSAAAAAAAVRQMYTFSDSFGEKFPRGKEEKEGKVGDVS